MGFPPEVEPHEQQTEGQQEDEGPQQLPLSTHTEEKIQLIISNTLLKYSDTYTDKLFQPYNNDNTHNTFSGLVALPWRLKN